MSIPSTRLTGRTIREVRPLTAAEMAAVEWHFVLPPMALVLDSGTILFPSEDLEGNDAGYFVVHHLDDLSLLVGRVITGARPMREYELMRHEWMPTDGLPNTLLFGNGVVVYPANGSELNGPGVLFGLLPNGTRTSWHHRVR